MENINYNNEAHMQWLMHYIEWYLDDTDEWDDEDFDEDWQ